MIRFIAVLFLAGLAALILAGCSTNRATVGVDTRVSTLTVPEYRRCLRDEDIPALPSVLGSRPATLQAALDVALAKLVEFMGDGLDYKKGGYAAKADAAMRGCPSKR